MLALAPPSKARLAGRACRSASALMRAAGRTVKRGGESTAYDLSGLSYLAGASDAFVALADVEIVVQGRRLPVHSQLLARSCDVWAALFESQTALGPSTPTASAGSASAGGPATGATPAQRTYATVAAEAAAAAALDQPLVFEGSFQGDSLASVDAFLYCVYRPEEVQERVQGVHQLGPFAELLGLADRFNHARLLRALVAHLEAAVSEGAGFLRPGHSPAARLRGEIDAGIFAWLDLSLMHHLDGLRAHCLHRLMRQLASPTGGPVLLGSPEWRGLPDCLRCLVMEGVLSAAHQCMCYIRAGADEARRHVRKATLLAPADLATKLPDLGDVLSWQGTGDFAHLSRMPPALIF